LEFTQEAVKTKKTCDVKFLFISRPDGEKIIKILLEDKNLLAVLDLIMDLIFVFR
jgi:hypothetical protein